MDQTDDVVREFLEESHETLARLEADLGLLEREVTPDLVRRVLRAFHTIKGTCSFFGFSRLESLCHGAESVLSPLRSGHPVGIAERRAAVLQLVEAMREDLDAIAATGAEAERFEVDVAQVVRGFEEPALAPSGPEPESEDPINLGELLIQSGLVGRQQVAIAAALQRQGDPRRIGEILVETAKVPTQAIVRALETQRIVRPDDAAPPERTIRVSTDQLDRLSRLVEELTVARDQLVALRASLPDPAIGAVRRVNLLTSELESGVRQLRLQRVGVLWSPIPRLVRDLAAVCNKQVQIELAGKEVEVDRVVIEAMKDPLTHIVRNAIDHGFETSELRVEQGKDPEGRLILRASRDHGAVSIEISDDGCGIDPAEIKSKAIALGAITPSQGEQMSDRELTNLVFIHGLSTAGAVTKVSGRGVGMDVVRTNVERVGGTVEVSSAKGVGTTLRIRIPAPNLAA